MMHLGHSTFAALYLLSDFVVFNETQCFMTTEVGRWERDRENAGAGGRERE